MKDFAYVLYVGFHAKRNLCDRQNVLFYGTPPPYFGHSQFWAGQKFLKIFISEISKSIPVSKHFSKIILEQKQNFQIKIFSISKIIKVFPHWFNLMANQMANQAPPMRTSFSKNFINPEWKLWIII